MNIRKLFANPWYGVGMLLGGVLLFASACAGPIVPPPAGQSGRPASPVPPPQLTVEDLQNAEYQGIYKDQTVQLTGGKYEGEPFVEGGASRPTVTMPPFHAFGDLNGDGTDDAVVTLVENSGGSGSFWYLAAVLNRDGEPRNVATQFLGDRGQVQSISIDEGQIIVKMVAHGPDDPMCCPTQEVSQVYELKGDELVKVSEEPATESEAGALENVVWTLVSYGNPGDPQAVLEGSEITAVFDKAEGKVSGSAGCNRYFAGFTVDDSKLSLSPVGSTMMMCPEEDVMAQEQAYLAALQTAGSYQIEGDQLRITSSENRVLIFTAAGTD